MADHQNDNKRIAKNTVVVYINLFLNLAIGLVSSRLVLQALGVSDFGLYNVAGGVALLFVFIANALSGTTVRFVNVEMGKTDGDINHIFNVCRVLHLALAVILLLIVEIGGIWYIQHYLNVEPGKETDAMFVFQVAAITMCLGIMNVPYSSLFNAMEKFLFSSLVNLAGKVIEFALVVWLLSYDGNRIRAYALIMISSTVVPFVVYHLSCYREWQEYVKWKLVKGWHHYKEALIYSYYNLLSGAAGMVRSQGAALLINYFFGTAINGAFAVAKNMERHLVSFSTRFQETASPQVTQSYSSGDNNRVYFLISRTGKYAMLMMLLAFFPLWAEMGFVLDIWLDRVPDGALLFCRLVLIMVFVSITGNSVSQVIDASGKVSHFRRVYSLLTISCLPIGFFSLKAGASPYVLLVLFIAVDIIFRVIQLWMAKRILHFPVKRFCQDTYLPVMMVFMVMTLCVFLTKTLHWDSALWHLGRFILIFILTACTVFFCGLKKSEREKLLNHLIRHFNYHR